MRVLFLTKYPEEGASSRYRVYQYLPYLEKRGISCSVKPFMSQRMYQLVFKKGKTVRKFCSTALAVFRRIAVLIGVGKYDLIFLQRECFPFGPPFMERYLKARGLPTIFDYDDALFIFKSSTHNSFMDFVKRPGKIYEIFSIVDCVVTGNDYLTEKAAEFCPDARTLLVGEDTEKYSPKPESSASHARDFVIGWLGSPSTEKYLRLIEEPLRRVCTIFPHVRLKIVGGGSFEAKGIPVEHVRWELENEVSMLHSFDVGIMPLPMEEWSKGKSGGKARTYMSVGLPVVCTAIGFNLELITHGVNGFLVSEADEWVDVLSNLIEDPELRRRVGASARQHVVDNLSLAVIAPQLYEVIRSIADPKQE